MTKDSRVWRLLIKISEGFFIIIEIGVEIMKKFTKYLLVAVMLLSIIILSVSVKAEEVIVVVGTSAAYKPWAYQENDEVKGYEIDVWNEIAERNGYTLEIKLGQFSGLVGMLDAGEIDTVAHQMSITPEREEKYYFSAPYAYSYYDFFVPTDSEIQSKEDLNGLKVGCWLGGNGEATLRQINDDYNLNLDITTYDGAPMEQEALIGRIDAFWQGEIKTLSVIEQEDLDLRQLNERLVYEVNAYPFRQDEAGKKLSEEVAKTIEEMREDGTLKELSEKWFGIDVTQVADEETEEETEEE